MACVAQLVALGEEAAPGAQGGVEEGEVIFFTSDTHFGHENIIRYCQRPFADVGEMDRELIAAWNDEVGEEDTVYHLADFTLGDEHQARDYFRQLNGRIFMLGLAWHHDCRWLPIWRQVGTSGAHVRPGQIEFYSASHHKVNLLGPVHVLELHELGNGRFPLAITLSHYQMAVWDRSHYGAWHLFGHSHGTSSPPGHCLDVGVDVWDYRPVSLDRVIWAMRERGWAKGDD